VELLLLINKGNKPGAEAYTDICRWH